MEFNEKLENYSTLIENYLDRCVRKENLSQSKLFEAMRYSLLSGGKRIRPVLLLEFCSLCNGDTEAALPFACAIEMIHTYSLIHDDLPCMDDDKLRRGKPSNHIIYGEALSLLSGDGLLNAAFEVMLNPEASPIPYEKRLRAAYEIASKSGAYGMIGGQVIDLESEAAGNKIELNVLTNMHFLKTGAIITAACKAGCILAGAKEDKVESAGIFAANIGLAFQIRDDMLDVEGNENKLGKKTGSDKNKQKTTFCTYFELEECRNIVKSLTIRAKKALEAFEGTEFLLALADSLAEREK